MFAVCRHHKLCSFLLAVSLVLPKAGVHFCTQSAEHLQGLCSSISHWFQKCSGVLGAAENQNLAWHWTWPWPGVVHLKVQQEEFQSPWGKVPALQEPEGQRTLDQNLLFLPRKIMCSLTHLASGSFSSMSKYQVIWRCVQFLIYWTHISLLLHHVQSRAPFPPLQKWINDA